MASMRRSPAGAGLAGFFMAVAVAACQGDPLPKPDPLTIHLTGIVHEAGSPSIPVVGASVEVIGGPAAGPATSTDWWGGYSLTDVPADGDIRVSKDGYAPAVISVRRRVHLTPSLSGLDVPLTWAGGPGPDVSGSYTLTLSAHCSAASALPAPLRTRQYSATIVRRSGSEVEVQLGGADFVIEQGSGKGNRFAGRVGAEGILFDLEAVYDWGPHPSVLERVADGWLEISGRARARYSATGLSGTLNGSFNHYPGSQPSWYVFTPCPSDAHQFVFSR